MMNNDDILKTEKSFNDFVKQMKKSGVTDEHIQMCLDDMQKYAIEQINKQLIDIFKDINKRINECKECLEK